MEMKRETNNKEDSIHTIVFTAAILFMSLRPTNLDHSSETESSVEQVKSDNKEKKKPSGGSQETEEGKDCYIKQSWSSSSTSTGSNTDTYVDAENEVAEEDEEDEEEEEHVPVLSKEELNERVEAFITMFRQHLISDVKQAESFRLHKIEVSCC
ncbi:hypothetical protein VIGAN_11028900 [Vigna angularis var. angularis]|uniref:Uncharacterized protein n=1 Tax=Vigna angularis var. angularis TaxID=157739 RepID=A0A0S3T7S9_PHAAN|nr:hypothetical protein VIGAN_11028900 [Vigna angularis var. angularis]